VSATGNKHIGEWIKAAEELAVNSTQHVCCPECGQPALKVRDVEYGWAPAKGLERYLVCSHCGAYNVVNLRRADAHCARSAEV
jgi:hypothetical protein